jgi:hypothetical protein
MDLYGRRLIGWAMDSRMKTDLVSAALKQAIGRTGSPKGVIVHSDRGVQYASKTYQKLRLITTVSNAVFLHIPLVSFQDKYHRNIGHLCNTFFVIALPFENLVFHET